MLWTAHYMIQIPLDFLERGGGSSDRQMNCRKGDKAMDIGKIGAAGNYRAGFYEKRQIKDSRTFYLGSQDFTQSSESEASGNGKDMSRMSADRKDMWNAFYTGNKMGIRNTPYLQERDMKSGAGESDAANGEESLSESLMRKLRERMDEIFTMIENGETEPSYQIGGQSFTIKEWDRLMEEFDSIEDAIKAALEAAKEDKAVKADEASAKVNGVPIEDMDDAALTSESTSCTYPSSQEGNEKKMYITWYSPEGIYCKQGGIGDEFLWHIEFTDSSQYDKVMNFLNNFELDDNLRFASHENFWRDFLDDKIDVEDFREFFNSTREGVPDYTYISGDNVYIDKDKIKYAKYMNPLGTDTAER